MSMANTAGAADAHTVMPSLVGRKAIVTGGTLGIGRAIARLLAASGSEIFIFSRDSIPARAWDRCFTCHWYCAIFKADAIGSQF